jgi:hypothetical protein
MWGGDELALVSALTVPTVLYLGGAALATGSRARRILAMAPALCALAAPYAIPPSWPLARALDAMTVTLAIVRGSDLIVVRAPTTAGSRVVHAMLMTDSFKLRRAPPVFDVRAAMRVVGLFAVAAVGRALAFDVAPRLDPEALRLVVRWLGGLAYAYGFADAGFACIVLVHHALGFAVPPIHSDPIASSSVREFWGRRWNRIVGTWLHARFFAPLARRGHPALGMWVAFVVSALLHAYIAHAALGGAFTLIVGGFFALQGVLALVEGPIGQARWPVWAKHLWTMCVMTATSPLFTEAFLRVVGPT